MRYWSQGVNQQTFLNKIEKRRRIDGKTQVIKAGEYKNRKAALKAYIGEVYDRNVEKIGQRFKRSEFVENIYENSKAAGRGVKAYIKTKQLSRTFMTREEMGRFNTETTLRKMGEWKQLRQKLGRGDYEVERLGDKKDQTYEYKGKTGSFIIRFNKDYQIKKIGELYDIGIRLSDGTIKWGEGGRKLPWHHVL